jgi:hypothetical protein
MSNIEFFTNECYANNKDIEVRAFEAVDEDHAILLSFMKPGQMALKSGWVTFANMMDDGFLERISASYGKLVQINLSGNFLFRVKMKSFADLGTNRDKHCGQVEIEAAIFGDVYHHPVQVWVHPKDMTDFEEVAQVCMEAMSGLFINCDVEVQVADSSELFQIGTVRKEEIFE